MGRKIETHDKFCLGWDKTLTNLLRFYPYFVHNGTNKQKSKQSLSIFIYKCQIRVVFQIAFNSYIISNLKKVRYF